MFHIKLGRERRTAVEQRIHSEDSYIGTTQPLGRLQVFLSFQDSRVATARLVRVSIVLLSAMLAYATLAQNCSITLFFGYFMVKCYLKSYSLSSLNTALSHCLFLKVLLEILD